MKKILVLDDEPTNMTYWWEALQDEGYTVVCCTSVEEAIRQYNADYYDLIVLDRMMPPGEIFGRVTDPAVKETGSHVLADFRDRRHLGSVPVIMLTNYSDDEAIEQLVNDYGRFQVVSKHTVPSEFVKIAADAMEQWPVGTGETVKPVIPDNEFPDIAPYHVWEVETDEAIRVHFERCSFNEHAEIFGAETSADGWDFADNFIQLLSHRDTCYQVHKLTCNNNVDLGVIGVYWSGKDKEHREWYRFVLFVVAPSVKYGHHDRKLRGVGEVMVARYLREWLWRHGKLPETHDFDAMLFDPEGVVFEPGKSMGRFLEALNFQPVPSTNLYRIHQADAEALLDRVTLYERQPVEA